MSSFQAFHRNDFSCGEMEDELDDALARLAAAETERDLMRAQLRAYALTVTDLERQLEIAQDPTQRAEATTMPEGAKGWVDQAGSAQVLAGGHGLDVAPDASPEGVRAEARREQDGGGKPSTAPMPRTCIFCPAILEEGRLRCSSCGKLQGDPFLPDQDASGGGRWRG